MIRCQHILSPLGQSLIRPDELVYNLQSMEVQVCQKMEDAALSRLYRGYQDAPDDLWVNELCGSSIQSFLMGKHSRSEWEHAHSYSQHAMVQSQARSTIWLSLDPCTILGALTTMEIQMSIHSPWHKQGTTWASSKNHKNPHPI